MRATRIMANLRVADIEAAKNFYTGYLGLSTEEFNMGWAARFPHRRVFLSEGIMIELLTSWTGFPTRRGISVTPA